MGWSYVVCGILTIPLYNYKTMDKESKKLRCCEERATLVFLALIQRQKNHGEDMT